MKHVISLASIVLCVLGGEVLSGCAQKTDPNISCKEAYDLIQAYEGDTSFVIIDFRPKEKFDTAHLKDAIYFDVFRDDVDEWLAALDKDKTYLIYCTIGHRTGIALEKMQKMGFENVYHMYEGVTVWEEQGYEVMWEEQQDETIEGEQ